MSDDDDSVGGDYNGVLTAKELKTLSAQLKHMAKTADDAANFAGRVDPQWAVVTAAAQTFLRRLAEDHDGQLTGDERMFVDAIQTCCNAVLRRVRVHHLHLEEPQLPELEEWDRPTLMAWRLNDLRRMCVAYEFRTLDSTERPINLGSSRAACVAAMLAFRKSLGHLKKLRKK